MIECLRKYDIDGLQFDYIRYGPHQCYCDYCQKTFARRYGFAPHDAGTPHDLPRRRRYHRQSAGQADHRVVLAEFYDGTPAIALNKLGEGMVLLLNWHAENEMPPAVAESVKLTLGSLDDQRQPRPSHDHRRDPGRVRQQRSSKRPGPL